MIEPLLCDDAFLADVDAAGQQPEGFHLWWLGQSGYLIRFGEHKLLVDPYLSDSLTRKYDGSDKPHVRMTARVVDPGRLTGISAVTSSHNHTDHLDAETLLPLLASNRGMRIVVPEANRQFAADRLGLDPARLVGVTDGQTVRIAPFELTGIPSAHEELERDEQGRPKFLGYCIRFDRWTVYHSGDTVRYDGLAERLARWNVDVALLPINGSKPERRVAGNLDGVEAARLAHEMRAGQVIPCHYDMFEFNTESPDAFVAECARLGQAYRVLQNGERWTWQLPHT